MSIKSVYMPMKLYATIFRRGSGAAENTHATLASCALGAWTGLVENIDEIDIVTMPEY